ncbi:hypothetical protein MHU86_23291 [Fragilaria crotonensis]|nr:hypothetical protein MHU86_23291 [Fragilaria crotonensis]
MSIARTMMLHSAIHWPDVADASLWPMAVQHAVFLHNHMPNQVSGLSPVDVFTKSRWQQHKFHDLHVWGCPVYVLDKSIADGKKLPLETSQHSSTPPRPISSTRETVHQQHDVVDNSIVVPTSTPVATVDSIVRAPTIPITPQHLPFSDLETPRAPTPLPTPPRPPSPSPTRMSPMRETTSTNDTSSAKEPPSAPVRSFAPSPAPVVRHSPRRSTRQRNAPSRLGYDGNQGAGYFVEPSAWIFQECGFLGPPLALKASLSDPDTLTYDEAMSDEPNLSKWMAAAAKRLPVWRRTRRGLKRKYRTPSLEFYRALGFSNVNGHPTV